MKDCDSSSVKIFYHILGIFIASGFLTVVIWDYGACSGIPDLIPFCITIGSLLIITNVIDILRYKFSNKWVTVINNICSLLLSAVGVWGIVITFNHLNCLNDCDDCNWLYYYVFLTSVLGIFNTSVVIILYCYNECHQTNTNSAPHLGTQV